MACGRIHFIHSFIPHIHNIQISTSTTTLTISTQSKISNPALQLTTTNIKPSAHPHPVHPSIHPSFSSAQEKDDHQHIPRTEKPTLRAPKTKGEEERGGIIHPSITTTINTTINTTIIAPARAHPQAALSNNSRSNTLNRGAVAAAVIAAVVGSSKVVR